MEPSSSAAIEPSSSAPVIEPGGVDEFIRQIGNVYPGLGFLSGLPNVKVVLRADLFGAPSNKVAVISGGLSGQEPPEIGFVGDGMLTAAVCGEISTPPSVESILAGIRAVTGPPGCLLIIKNCIEDRLNFGLATERAKAEGYKVEMVIVCDDREPLSRGIGSGIIFVLKIAGAAADGVKLEELTRMTVRISKGVDTVSLYPKEESGGCSDVMSGVNVKNVLNRILPQKRWERIGNVALLINGPGGISRMKLMTAVGVAVSQVNNIHFRNVDRVYADTFIMFPGMTGFSISMIKSDPTILKFLDAPTEAPNWTFGFNGNQRHTSIPKLSIPILSTGDHYESPRRPDKISPQGLILELSIKKAVKSMQDSKTNLNSLDNQAGAYGTIMCDGASTILRDMSFYPLNNPVETPRAIASSVRNSVWNDWNTL